MEKDILDPFKAAAIRGLLIKSSEEKLGPETLDDQSYIQGFVIQVPTSWWRRRFKGAGQSESESVVMIKYDHSLTLIGPDRVLNFLDRQVDRQLNHKVSLKKAT